MLINEVFIDAFSRIQEVVHTVCAGMDEEKLATRPAANANTIAWLVWHLTRVQDDHMAEVAKGVQIWVSEGWAEKFDLPFEKSVTGYGMTTSDVRKVRASAELLIGYHDAVNEQTKKFLKHLKENDYKKVVDDRWDPAVTLAVRLVSVITDDLQHAGQAAFVRGLLG